MEKMKWLHRCCFSNVWQSARETRTHACVNFITQGLHKQLHKLKIMAVCIEYVMRGEEVMLFRSNKAPHLKWLAQTFV